MRDVGEQTIKVDCVLVSLILWFLGSAKDAPIVTPLMDYIRQKRAAKSGARVGDFLL